MDKQIKQFEELLGKKVKLDEPLAKHTTFKIGGPAKYFFVAENNEDLIKAITLARKLKIKKYILAGGSNVLVADSGFNGLVILVKTKGLEFKGDNTVIAEAGVILNDLVNKTVDKGLSGLEWAVGIPGTVGGAVRGNAGAYGSETGNNVKSVLVLRGSKQFELEKEQCEFAYRDSIFKHNNDLILSAKFQLGKGEAKKSQDKIKETLQQRNAKLPNYPSAGSVFKNIYITSDNLEQVKKIINLPPEYLEWKKIPTAWLIEQMDLKGYKIGQAQVSEQHANFVVNLGQATANDVLQLLSYVKMKVRDEFSLQLMEEIEYVGF